MYRTLRAAYVESYQMLLRISYEVDLDFLVDSQTFKICVSS